MLPSGRRTNLLGRWQQTSWLYGNTQVLSVMLKRICQICLDQIYLCLVDRCLDFNKNRRIIHLLWLIFVKWFDQLSGKKNVRVQCSRLITWQVMGILIFVVNFMCCQQTFGAFAFLHLEPGFTKHYVGHLSIISLSLSPFLSNQTWLFPGGSQCKDSTWEQFSGVQACRHLCSIKMLIISSAISRAILL